MPPKKKKTSDGTGKKTPRAQCLSVEAQRLVIEHVAESLKDGRPVRQSHLREMTGATPAQLNSFVARTKNRLRGAVEARKRRSALGEFILPRDVSTQQPRSARPDCAPLAPGPQETDTACILLTVSQDSRNEDQEHSPISPSRGERMGELEDASRAEPDAASLMRSDTNERPRVHAVEDRAEKDDTEPDLGLHRLHVSSTSVATTDDVCDGGGDLSTALVATQSDVHGMISKLADAEQRAANLQTQLDMARSENEDLRVRFVAMEAKAMAEERNNSTLAQEVKKTKAELSALRDEVETYKAHAKSFDSKLRGELARQRQGFDKSLEETCRQREQKMEEVHADKLKQRDEEHARALKKLEDEHTHTVEQLQKDRVVLEYCAMLHEKLTGVDAGLDHLVRTVNDAARNDSVADKIHLAALVDGDPDGSLKRRLLLWRAMRNSFFHERHGIETIRHMNEDPSTLADKLELDLAALARSDRGKLNAAKEAYKMYKEHGPPHYMTRSRSGV